MKQLKIALICKNENSKKRDDRSMGYFSYDVPEFTWEHFTPGKNFTVDIADFIGNGFDLIIHEDYPYGEFVHLNKIPYVFLNIDSTLSQEHYFARYNQAKQADLVLVDHDDISRFQMKRAKTIQFPYCVNDKVFYRDDRERTLDIAYHCSSSAHAGIERRKYIRQLLHDLSVKHNWSYRSGVLDIHDYAESFRTAKIVVNQSRTPTNRPHRIFDAMACGAMVLTSPIPELLDSDKLTPFNYMIYDSDYELEAQLLKSLEHAASNSHREWIAENGYMTVMGLHTWSIRAKQLREIINKEFGI